MSGIRVNEWLHNSGTGGIWQSSAGNVGIASSVPTAKLVVTGDANISGVTTASTFVPSEGQLSHRNLIINGAMRVAQRGTSSTTSGAYTIDRIRQEFGGTDEAPTYAQVDVASGTTPYTLGFRKALKVTNGNQTSGAGAADYIQIDYRFEAQDIANSGWNYTSSSSNITLSFWIKSSVAQDTQVVLRTQDGTSQSFQFKTGTLSADTWTKVTKTIPGHANLQFDNDANRGLDLFWFPYIGTNYVNDSNTLDGWMASSGTTYGRTDTTTWYTTNDATYELTGIQLEVGSVATPFEHRSYGDELLRCQRYLQVLTSGDDDNYFGVGYYYNSTNAYMQYRMQPEMRTGPSVVQVTGTNYYYLYRDGAGDGFDGFTGFQWNSGTANAGRSGAFYNNTAMSGTAGQTGGFYANNNSAKISLDAEI